MSGEGRSRLVLTTGLASLLAPLNSSMIAVALPAVRSDFGVGVGAVTLLVSAYLVAVAVSQPAAGRLGDAFGHQRTVAVGLGLLMIFSALGALAWSFPMLVVARSLQGLTAALTLPNAVAYLRKHVEPERLGSVLGSNGAWISVGAALGPVAGGLLLAAGDWRLLFIANIPVAAVALLLMLRLKPDPGAGRQALTLDPISLLALALAFGGMTVLGSAARLQNPLIVAAGLAVLPAGAVLYAVRYRVAGKGVVDLKLFTRRNYAAASATTALANLVMYSILIAMPVYLKDVRDVDEAAVGGMLFLMSVSMVLMSPLAGGFADRLGSRPLMVAGALVLLTANAVLAAMLVDPAIWLLAGPLLLIGVAMGLSQAAQSSAALQAWPKEMAGSASGTYSMMRYAGSVTGAALIAAVLGSDPGEGDFRLLFGLLCVFAALNVFAAGSVRGRTAESGAQPEQLVTDPAH